MSYRYARRYVKRLNKLAVFGDLSDLSDVGGDFDDINGKQMENVSSNGDDGHFLFLSHYKVESGTEATLLSDAIASLLAQGPYHPAQSMTNPVFLDSSSLTDLRSLRDKVVSSHNFVVLLTPGVLTRPWCLVEIVTAVQSDVNIVPRDTASGPEVHVP